LAVSFNSLAFALFFAAVVAAYYGLPARHQNRVLLVASYVFYAWWDWRFLGLLLLTTVVDFQVGRRLPQTTGRARRGWLLISLVTNLGILGFFKYCNFFLASFNDLLQALHLGANFALLQVILPVGISFYTFKSLAYTIDVYRNKQEPTDKFALYALYVSYFPQLLAGPIERPQRLLPRLAEPRRLSREYLSSGAFLFLIGLARKVAIADAVAGTVNAVFAAPETASSPLLLRAAFLFALQIYADFSGYSDMARGISRLLGIETMENFNHPYLATSVGEFWHRWHISLSTWLRDYLYIPLGGSRGRPGTVYRNLLLTMVLGGLWHGASWTFVIWGFLHGLALSVQRAWSERRAAAGPSGSAPRVVMALASWAFTMAAVGLAWIFFKAPNFTAAGQFLSGLVHWNGMLEDWMVKLPVLALALTLFIDLPQVFGREHCAVLRWPWPLRSVYYSILILVCAVLRPTSNVPFVYFQF